MSLSSSNNNGRFNLQIINKYKIPYLFIAPFFILFIVFQLIPLVWTFFISCTSWKGVGTPRFIGTDNYKLLLDDYMVKDAVINTSIYWVSSLIIILTFATLIALCLNSSTLKCKSFFSVVTFLPYVCASVAMGLIFSMIFDFNAGFINEVLVTIGMSRIPWLTSSQYARIPVILLFNWRIIPWFTVIILSGLVNIPRDYYEAATVDGANHFQMFFRITLPLLKNIMFFCGLTITVDVWKMFNESYTLSGPGSSNISLFQLIYEYAFSIFKLGYASALSVLLIIILLLISIIYVKLKKKKEEI